MMLQGFHDIEQDDYRKIIDHVSPSELKVFKDSPYAYKEIYMEGRRRRKKRKAQETGIDVHTAVLEWDRFKSEYAQLPDMDLRSKAAKDIKKGYEEAQQNVKFLPFDDYQACVEIRETLMDDENFVKLFDGCTFEKSMFWADPRTGTKCKGRTDAFNLSRRYVLDLKTTQNLQNFDHDSLKYNYHLQAAMYLWGLSEITESLWQDFYWVVVETEFPYRYDIVSASPEVLRVGMDELSGLMGYFTQCKQNNHWPRKKIEAIRSGGLPEWYIRQKIETNYKLEELHGT